MWWKKWHWNRVFPSPYHSTNTSYSSLSYEHSNKEKHAKLETTKDKVKGKVSLYRPGQALGAPGGSGSHNV